MNTSVLIQPAVANASMLTQPSDRALEIRTISGLDLVIIKGWSMDLNVGERYIILMEFISAHVTMKNELNLYFKYELFNSTTARYLFKIIMLLNRLHRSGKEVRIHWACGDTMDEMLDTGFDLAQLCEFEFKITLI